MGAPPLVPDAPQAVKDGSDTQPPDAPRHPRGEQEDQQADAEIGGTRFAPREQAERAGFGSGEHAPATALVHKAAQPFPYRPRTMELFCQKEKAQDEADAVERGKEAQRPVAVT